MTYVKQIEADNGDLIDIKVFCGEMCAREYTINDPDPFDYSDYPCYEPSSHAHCENCGESVKHGANCFAALTNEITDECPEADS